MHVIFDWEQDYVIILFITAFSTTTRISNAQQWEIS